MGEKARAADKLIEVVAGVMRDAHARVLLAQRPKGKHLAGTWEFPGGKREPGETPAQALERELHEELGITVGPVRPWLALTHRYPELSVRLQLFTVDDWRGEARGREGQALRWATAREMRRLPMPAADRPIVRALGLDERCAITPDPEDVGGPDGLLDWARGCLARGIRLIRLRAGSLDETGLIDLAGDFRRIATEFDARWLLDGPPELAEQVGADGVHLGAGDLLKLSGRPLIDDFLVGASCHSEAELARAGELALDFVTLPAAPSAPDQTDAQPIDWDAFARLCRHSPLPVYALGGVAPGDLERAREHGGFGVAGTRGFTVQQRSFGEQRRGSGEQA